MDQHMVDLARSYLGTRQADARHKNLVRQYNAVRPLPVGYQVKESDNWCAVFITVLADLAKEAEAVGRECGVHRFVQLFKKKGSWLGLKQPQVGDLVVFDWQKNGWLDHIGLVEKVEGTKITTIEGNTSKQVARRFYPRNDWRIAGYARPKYKNKQQNTLLSTHQVAREVIQGKWGNGEERIKALKAAGYQPESIQKEVNAILNSQNSKIVANESIAREVIAGKWGKGEERKKKLIAAGFDAQAVQKIVNELLKKK